MEDWVWAIISPIIAFIIGSIPFSFIVTKLKSDKDLRDVGTKNVGGLNAMGQAGIIFGALAGFLDLMKGFACVLTVILIDFDETPLYSANENWQLSWHSIICILVAVSVILGHNYSIFLKFKGGRGLAAALGILWLVNPLLVAIIVLVNLISILIIKYVNPSTFIALVIIIPISFFISIYPPWLPLFLHTNIMAGLMTTGLVLAMLHKYTTSFFDMFRGKEYKAGDKKVSN